MNKNFQSTQQLSSYRVIGKPSIYKKYRANLPGIFIVQYQLNLQGLLYSNSQFNGYADYGVA